MIDVEKILRIGIERGASDIHLVCGNKPIIRVRKDLIILEDMHTLTKDDMFNIFYYFVGDNEERKIAYEKNKKADIHYEIDDTTVRINASFSNEVPIYTIRIVRSVLPNFDTLGLPSIIKRIASQPQGLILVTGKPNSGKSTTLNALVNEINKKERKKILMLENPIEFAHKSNKSLIIQKEVGEGKDCLSFGDGAMNALREDCDILVIGEIRDKKTMDAAIEMAESGHLVIGTLHTKSCTETIDRLVTFYDERDRSAIRFMMASLLKLVVTQRLIKGVTDRLVLVPEVMVVDEVISGLIRRDKFPASEIEDAIQSRSERGNISFFNSLSQLVIDGRITEEQAKGQVEEKDHDTLIRTIKQMRIRNAR